MTRLAALIIAALLWTTFIVWGVRNRLRQQGRNKFADGSSVNHFDHASNLNGERDHAEY